MKNKKSTTRRFFRNFSVVVGIVLIWRGVWYALDGLDAYFFQGGHVGSTIGGIILGLIILYIPDRDFDELGRL